jgi:DNA-binding transcriptional MerR regulator
MAGPADETTTYSIAEAADRVGLSADTLRYYERDGLLVESPGRAPSGHRRYTEKDLAWFGLITRLRATGMPIRTVRAYADLCRQGEGNELARLELLYRHRDQVLAQLAEVTDHLEAINRTIGADEESVLTASRTFAGPASGSDGQLHAVDHVTGDRQRGRSGR